MSASSLIFVVIFAVWAAYMLQYWVRRREDLATARSVDRFSEAMRMLERRTPVKAEASPRHDEARPGVLRRQVSTAPTTESDATGATPVSALDRVKKSAASGAGRVAGRAPKFSLTSPEAKLGVLVAATAFFLLTLVLAPFGVVPGWLPLLGLVAVGGTVMWLRRVAVQNRAARAARPAGASARTASARTASARPTAARPARAAGATAVRPVAATVVDEVEVHEQQAAPRTVAPAEPKRSPLVAEHVAREDVVFDQEPDMNAAAHAEAAVFDAGWAPVEVPRPTYTMKAKAERETVAPAATVATSDARPLAARYENTPVSELPFDGMALDEDYEELPQVYRAG